MKYSLKLWGVLGIVLTLIISIPIISIFFIAISPDSNIWKHLISTVLPIYTANTLLLMLGNIICVCIIGIPTAWLVTSYTFFGRNFFSWALILPLAVPAYIIAFVYTDIMEYSGALQIFLRNLFNWNNAQDYWFPNIRSIGGAIFVMSFVLYPYVYLLCRSSFQHSSARFYEVSRTLGYNVWSTFFKLSLPLTRPALVIGCSLVMMETLADFGTVDFFSINTLTLAIFNVWLGMGNAAGAAQISLVILFFVFALLYFEKSARNRKEYHTTHGNNIFIRRNSLKGYKSFIAFLICFIPLLIGFIIPSMILFYYSLLTLDISFGVSYYKLILNSFSLSFIASIVTVLAAIVIASGQRLYGNKFIIFTRISLLGYAFPGAVLALGIIIPLAYIDNYIDKLFYSYFNISTGLILSGSIFALLFAYLIRFIAIGYGAIDSGYLNINKNIDMASISLGIGKFLTIKKIHIPLLKSSILIASIIVFVDTMKELPATLILRPFNFDTLATNVYQLASDELLEQSSLSALTIVLVGIVPLIFLTRKISNNKYFS
ncbi:MAG: hypothetical protein CFH01_01387 [Alphaproteobacteria bacterium MarineAlpha2_Bin1]|nr:MAG: hypothetical protein CFH01_01387 [Alphaproteobacteria bacterium MarineAlpha2_Bin1]